MFKESSGEFTIEMNVRPNNFNDDSELTVEEVSDLLEVSLVLVHELAKIKYMMINNKDTFDSDTDEIINTYLAPGGASVVIDESIEIMSKYSKRLVEVQV